MIQKTLKTIGIFFAVIFVIGMIGLALETPEQKAEREAQMAKEQAAADAKKAQEKAEREAKEGAEKEAKVEAQEQAQKQEKPTKETQAVNGDFGMTPQQFDEKIVVLLNEVLKTKDKAGNITLEKTGFGKDLTPNLVWGGMTNNGNVSSVLYTMTLDGDTQTNVTYLLFHMGVSARILSPELPKEQTGGEIVKLLNNAMNKALETKSDVKEEVVIDGYKYGVSITPSINLLMASIHKEE